MLFKAVVAVLMIIAGLAAIIWVANWPFSTLWEKDLTAEQRRINAAHNRRHHRGVARILLPGLAVIFGFASVSILSGPKSDSFAAVVMGVCSAVCAGIFGALIKKGGRRRSSPRR
ncbi:hypothetical protein SAMN05443287_101539 [Micromonospora phaseoli]|uniref:Uncharacterized protein n=1 Tax=Micromonospora phaseoli TaxID=1144548 RepID=A0A1H6SFK3_9ACTN|nr:hypothetical protein [Micromonospora phaseoli]PZW03788.1 hypothetical protein CLV64_101539 [Micromonospora phaseoli]GIJ79086.1 hypothetical protein Xph01_35180 [Micromonospora phaseoli]SEI62535.1 hypothetical protein SAMN05443287_101539 [Micromonospora phaseoli]